MSKPDNPSSPQPSRMLTEVEIPSAKEFLLSKPPSPARPQKPLSLWISLTLSATYITTSIAFLLMVRYSKNLEKQGLLSYDSTVIVMAVELTKILVSVFLKYAEDGEMLLCAAFCGERRWELWQISLSYVLPALLYALYNNLTYYNLHHFDPSTVQIFMQSRILFTGILFTLLLGRILEKRQWLSLALLTLGLILKYISPTVTVVLDLRVFMLFFQAFLSSLAGVYNEFAFKRDSHMSIHQQNFFMYFYGVVFNLLFGLLVAPQEYIKGNSFRNPHIIFIPIIILGAANGLTAALILKHIDVIVKSFASSVEVLIMALIAAAVLGESLDIQDIIAAFFVMCAVYLYYTKGWLSKTQIKPK